MVLVRVFARRQIFINLDRFEHEEGAEEATDETFFWKKKKLRMCLKTPQKEFVARATEKNSTHYKAHNITLPIIKSPSHFVI